MGNHIRLIRQFFLAEDIILRQTGQVVGKRLRLGFGGGLRNRLPGSLSSGLTGGVGNRFLRGCRGSLRPGLRDGFLGTPGRFRSRRLCRGFRNLDGFHSLGAGGGGLRRLLRQRGLGQCAHCQHRRQQDGNDPLSIFHLKKRSFLSAQSENSSSDTQVTTLEPYWNSSPFSSRVGMMLMPWLSTQGCIFSG